MAMLSAQRDKVRRSTSALLYLASLGLVAAATIIMFSAASVSLFGPSKEMFAGSRISDSLTTEKFIGTVVPAHSNAAPVAPHTKSPSLIKAKNLPSATPVPPPSGVPHEEAVAKSAVAPSEGEASAAPVETGNTPRQGPATDQTGSPELSGSQQVIVQPPPITDEVSAAANPSGTTMPTRAGPDGQRDPLFRDFETPQNQPASLDEGSVASHEKVPAPRARSRRSDDHLAGLGASFRYRVKKECGPIHDPALYRHCVASFSAYRR